jgi:ATP-dependent protease ClpP protease subunit
MSTIYLTGTVGAPLWDEAFFTAASVREQLAGVTGDLTVVINSGGGSATEGAAIYTLLRDYPGGTVTTVTDGAAASAASLIFMAGESRIIRAGAFVLIHDPAQPYTAGRGTEDDHELMVRQLRVIADGYASIYAERAGISVKEARQIMKDETVMDGAMAMQLGFATATDALVTASAPAAFDWRIYAHAPRALREQSERYGASPGTPAIMAMFAGQARPKETSPMNAVTDTTAPEMAQTPTMKERARAKRITDMVAASGLPISMATTMIEDGATLEMAADTITAEWAKAGDTQMASRGRAHVGKSFDSPEAINAQMADAFAARLAPRMGVTHEPTVGRSVVHLTMPEMAMALAKSRGLNPGNATDAMRMMSHTTSDFPLIIGSGLQSVLAKSLAQAPVAILRAAGVIDAADYRTGFSVGLSGASAMPVVGESGEIKSATLDERGEAKAIPANRALMITVSREALVNDAAALNVFTDMTRAMLKSANETQRAALLAPLLANAGAGQTMRDGQPLFHASHGNLAAAGSVLDVTSLSTARVAMRRQKDSRGNIMAIEPWALVVPPEQETRAQQLVETLAANTVASVNPFAESMEIIVEPGLASINAFYVIANPALVEGLTIAYLNGQKAPQIETQEGWQTLGTQFRMVWPLGCAMHDWAAWYRNPGA